VLVSLAAAPLATLAAGRAEAVELGPASVLTAFYDFEAPGGDLLAPGSDPELRVRVLGDLASADRVAVIVPGVGHGAKEFEADVIEPDSMLGRAWALFDAGAAESASAALGEDGAPSLAVIAFLGYAPPKGADALAAGGIRAGAANLAELQRGLARAYPDAQVTWACHSFGSLVCASALAGASPDAVVFLGSPGVMVPSAQDLPTSAPVFAARGPADPIALAALLRALGGGFGPNPASEDFGATILPADRDAGHSDYFRPGSTQLAALAEVVMADRR
jgi:hypothetical protein